MIFTLYSDVVLSTRDWAAAWQNEQNDVRPAKTQIRLIRPFAVRMKKHWVLSYPLSARRRLIRLGGYPGWSESSLGAHVILLVLACCSSINCSARIDQNCLLVARLNGTVSFGASPLMQYIFFHFTRYKPYTRQKMNFLYLLTVSKHWYVNNEWWNNIIKLLISTSI